MVGLSTEKNGETIFFKTTPTDSFEYLIRVKSYTSYWKAQKITSHVAVSTSHNLTELDTIDLTINSNIRWFGVSTSVKIFCLTGINPGAQANIGADTIFKDDHGFVNGQKNMMGSASATGLTTTVLFCL